MPRASRLLLASTAVLVAVLALAVLFINLHLQSHSMQNRLRDAARSAIGMPLSIRSTTYTPWSGIRLRGLVLPDSNNGANFLEASEFQVLFRLLPLLQREVIIHRVLLKRAVVTWRQGTDGRWRLPGPGPETVRESDSAIAEVAAASPTPPPQAPTPLETADAVVAPEPGIDPRPSAPAFKVSVQGFEVVGSRIVFENRDGWPLLDADGIAVEGTVQGHDAAGTARVQEAVVAGLLVARNLEGRFALEDNTLLLNGLRCEVAGGKLEGQGRVATRQPGSPFSWDFALDRLDMSTLTLPPAFAGNRLDGLLSGRLNLEGAGAPDRRLQGSGRLDLVSARLVPSAYLRDIGKTLGIRELQGMEFSKAFAEFSIETRQVMVSRFFLQSEELAVEMSGPVGHDGRLDLQARLLVSPRIADRIAALTRKNLRPADNQELPDYRQVEFAITGTLDAPRTDLITRVMGGGLGGRVGEFIFNFLRSGR